MPRDGTFLPRSPFPARACDGGPAERALPPVSSAGRLPPKASAGPTRGSLRPVRLSTRNPGPWRRRREESASAP
jgi:hypothetical protein